MKLCKWCSKELPLMQVKTINDDDYTNSGFTYGVCNCKSRNFSKEMNDKLTPRERNPELWEHIMGKLINEFHGYKYIYANNAFSIYTWICKCCDEAVIASEEEHNVEWIEKRFLEKK